MYDMFKKENIIFVFIIKCLHNDYCYLYMASGRKLKLGTFRSKIIDFDEINFVIFQ